MTITPERTFLNFSAFGAFAGAIALAGALAVPTGAAGAQSLSEVSTESGTTYKINRNDPMELAAEKNFDAVDKDDSGTLNREEFPYFVKMMAKAGQPNAKRAVMMPFGMGYKIGFRRADLDKNGEITPKELRSVR